jgi:hypothetical protein
MGEQQSHYFINLNNLLFHILFNHFDEHLFELSFNQNCNLYQYHRLFTSLPNQAPTILIMK